MFNVGTGNIEQGSMRSLNNCTVRGPFKQELDIKSISGKAQQLSHAMISLVLTSQQISGEEQSVPRH